MARSSGAGALPRSERLRGAGAFQEVFQRGKRIEAASFLLLWLPTPASWKIGFAVSRQVRGAVRRNRVRRRLREAFRSARSGAPLRMSVVIIGRPPALTRTMGDLVQDMKRAIGGLGGTSPRRERAADAPDERR
jgi:ribonuclease P protein component